MSDHETRIDIRALEVEAKCRAMAEPLTQFVVCASHLRAAIAAAEERGRRSGVEEAKSLDSFVRHLQALVEDGYTEGALNAIRALRASGFPSLAPRDSAPARDPYVEAGVGDWAGAPRDSGKETA